MRTRTIQNREKLKTTFHYGIHPIRIHRINFYVPLPKGDTLIRIYNASSKEEAHLLVVYLTKAILLPLGSGIPPLIEAYPKQGKIKIYHPHKPLTRYLPLNIIQATNFKAFEIHQYRSTTLYTNPN